MTVEGSFRLTGVRRLDYTYREANGVVDFLAKIAVYFDSSISILNEPPQGSVLYLHFDVLGTYVPRLVPLSYN